jgi:hypothetical protein
MVTKPLSSHIHESKEASASYAVTSSAKEIRGDEQRTVHVCADGYPLTVWNEGGASIIPWCPLNDGRPGPAKRCDSTPSTWKQWNDTWRLAASVEHVAQVVNLVNGLPALGERVVACGACGTVARFKLQMHKCAKCKLTTDTTKWKTVEATLRGVSQVKLIHPWDAVEFDSEGLTHDPDGSRTKAGVTTLRRGFDSSDADGLSVDVEVRRSSEVFMCKLIMGHQCVPTKMQDSDSGSESESASGCDDDDQDDTSNGSETRSQGVKSHFSPTD